MSDPILAAWMIVGFAGGLFSSTNAYTWRGVIGFCMAGIILGPLSFCLSGFKP